MRFLKENGRKAVRVSGLVGMNTPPHTQTIYKIILSSWFNNARIQVCTGSQEAGQDWSRCGVSQHCLRWPLVPPWRVWLPVMLSMQRRPYCIQETATSSSDLFYSRPGSSFLKNLIISLFSFKRMYTNTSLTKRSPAFGSKLGVSKSTFWPVWKKQSQCLGVSDQQPALWKTHFPVTHPLTLP